LCREESAADENIERKWPLALDGHALPAINFDLNELEHGAAGMFAPWVSSANFHRKVVGLFSARNCQRPVLKPATQRLNSAAAEAGVLQLRQLVAKAPW